MDLFGCVVVGCVTAIGGGTLRDVVLQRPPFWLTYSAHLHLCVWTTVFTFVLWPWVVGAGFKDTHLAFLWTDAIGMAASTVIGAHIGLVETDMAVVVSSGQNEVSEMKEKGLDMLPHRERIVKEDLETKFKDPEDPFRLVFVCAMWLTGFDAPSC